MAVFDKFLGDDEQAPLLRGLANLLIKPLFSDLNRRLGPLVRRTGLEITRDEPSAFGGLFRVVTLRRPPRRPPTAGACRYSLGFFRGSSAGLTIPEATGELRSEDDTASRMKDG